jgi:8-oxo-dGTP pyrophosphatase MutT (NUDIX family)
VHGKKRYLQFAALPYCVRDEALHVLLVTSRETKRWVIPKGWPEKEMAPYEVASHEAFEEAGLVGTAAMRPYATFEYVKRLGVKQTIKCLVEVFLFQVQRELDRWPEMSERERVWMTPSEAAAAVADPGLSEILLAFAKQQPGDMAHLP